MSFIWFLLLRLALVVGLVVSYPHYNENPVVIGIFIFLCIVFILFLGDDEILVYSDKIVLSTNSFASVIFKSKKKVYLISEIKEAYLPPTTITIPEMGLVLLIAMLTKKRTTNHSHPIFLEMTNEKTERIETYLEYDQRKKIVDTINSLIPDRTEAKLS